MSLDFSGYKILVVDDEEDLRDILSEDFTLHGATVFTAKNGREAFDIFLKERPEVVLSDVRMPGGDGVELLKKIKDELSENAPHIFLLTGFSDVRSEQAALVAGQGLVAKPFSLKDLRERVAKAIAHAPAIHKNR